MTTKNEYSGYGLFNDVEDVGVRDYNRGRTIVNILEDNSDEKANVSARGASLSAGYLLAIPQDERSAAYAEAEAVFQKRAESKVSVRN